MADEQTSVGARIAFTRWPKADTQQSLVKEIIRHGSALFASIGQLTVVSVPKRAPATSGDPLDDRTGEIDFFSPPKKGRT